MYCFSAAGPSHPYEIFGLAPQKIKFTTKRFIDLTPDLLGQFSVGGGYNDAICLFTGLHDPAEGILLDGGLLRIAEEIVDLRLVR